MKKQYNISSSTMTSFLCLVIVLFLTACYQPFDKVNLGDISEENFALFVADIHYAEAILSDIKNPEEKDSLAQIFYREILDKHQMETQEFDRLMEAYMDNPVALDSLYSKVIRQIKRKRTAAEKK